MSARRLGVLVAAVVLVASTFGLHAAVASMDTTYLWQQSWPENSYGTTYNNVSHIGNSVWLMSSGSAYERHVQSFELGHVYSNGNIYMSNYPERFDTLYCWWESDTQNGTRFIICQYDRPGV